MQCAVFFSALSVQKTVFSISIMKYFLPWNMRDCVVDENEKVLTAGKAVAAVVIVDSSDSNGENENQGQPP